MADDVVAAAEQPLRANKRRKIFRQRTDDNELPSTIAPAASAAQEDGQQYQSLSQVKRPASRKAGIVFTSTRQPQQQSDVEASEETAVVRMHPEREQRNSQTNRFVKPTGKVAVVDDMHMTAFIDSKLAEMRSATFPPHDEDESSGILANARELEERQGMSTGPAPSTSDPQRRRHGGKPPPRPRRQPAPRNPHDEARDSFVESILRESSTLPLYDRSSAGTPLPTQSGDEDANANNEEAAAEAFKAQFLMDVEEQNRRKPPNPAAFSKVAQAKGVDRTSHGPKLGGSRQQRERMKAAQAAEGASGGVKK